MRDQILQNIFDRKLIAIVRGVEPERMEQVMQALLDGGICMAEITFDHTSKENRRKTLDSLERIRNRFGEKLFLGAGTVLTEEDVTDAFSAGAQYIISPNVNRSVIEKTRELELVSMPGAFTPTEAVDAYQCGADIVKLFPAAALGIEYIKALRGPLNFIPFSAVGGVTPQSIPEFLDAGISCFGIGSNLVNAKRVREGDFTSITNTAKDFTAVV